jgi:5-methylcytosine-specific restriction endonuclease McrA
MKNHTKIYFKHFGYDTSDTIYCEVCNAVAVDLHHIEAKGMGGNPNGDKDTITNIQALCRSCHEHYGDKKQYKDFLKSIHYRVLGIEKATIADDEQHEVTPEGKIIFKHEK